VESKEITVLELANKWLELKRMEISTNAMSLCIYSAQYGAQDWRGQAGFCGNAGRPAVYQEGIADRLSHPEGRTKTPVKAAPSERLTTT
jgi:hypothetical protein